MSLGTTTENQPGIPAPRSRGDKVWDFVKGAALPPLVLGLAAGSYFVGKAIHDELNAPSETRGPLSAANRSAGLDQKIEQAIRPTAEKLASFAIVNAADTVNTVNGSKWQYVVGDPKDGHTLLVDIRKVPGQAAKATDVTSVTITEWRTDPKQNDQIQPVRYEELYDLGSTWGAAEDSDMKPPYTLPQFPSYETDFYHPNDALKAAQDIAGDAERDWEQYLIK
jgi:hypothetical protein